MTHHITPPRLVLSPCGTSLLTHGSTHEERTLLVRHANATTLEDMGNDRAAIQARVDNIRRQMSFADAAHARRASAELNGILTLCDEEPKGVRYNHILLRTGTWLGQQTGDIVATWLRHHGHTISDARSYPDLQTANLPMFQFALSELVHQLTLTLDDFRRQGYRIVFNLTGGFKSVQGFLQTLGNLYADETVYVFEAPNSPLLRIPRLPVRLDATETVRRHIRAIRRLANSLKVPDTELSEVPETFLLRMDHEVSLSPWGALVWDQVRKELYGERVWPSPSDRFEFGRDFLKSTQNQPSDRLLNLNDKLDKLAVYLESSHRRPPQSLDLKPIKGNPTPPSTHEFDAWADRDAKRVYCHYQDNTLVLDRLGAALH